MAQIKRSLGLTPAEQFLAALADQTFLSLWAYPNVYRDKGKELCDLLVVCGQHVLVFSDKSSAWPEGVSEDLAWKRWYRRAIGKSASQLHRAINWVGSHPDRLFLDAKCTEIFPIKLPPFDEMRVHGVIVARGASNACRRHFKSGSGSLGLMPLTGRTRAPSETPPTPFYIGNPAPSDRAFYHVFDDVSLRILLSELDTITDFTAYLTKKRG